MAEREHIIALRGIGPAYESDYAGWLQHQIELMKAGRWSDLDDVKLIDEVESLGRSDFKGFVSAFEILIAHMLKWDYQPERRTRSWQASILEHRRRIETELEDSPSYASRIEEAISRAYRTAAPRALKDTGLPMKAFPEQCPYTSDEIMNREHMLDD